LGDASGPLRPVASLGPVPGTELSSEGRPPRRHPTAPATAACSSARQLRRKEGR
jgi:hypothetical protein